jgi:two-component system chemotaxis response regulator CheB
VNIVNIKNDLIEKVKLFGRRKIKLKKTINQIYPMSVIDRSPCPGRNKINIIIIGASTGGPKALQDIIPRLPNNLPCGVLVIQHMLPVFTASFAERMRELSQVEVREAKDGDVIGPGLVLVAPGGFHLTVRKMPGNEYRIKLSKEPPMLHMPSVDIAMESAAQVFSEHTLGVIMTGMGQDGKIGMKSIKEAKGKTIAQDEESSVIFGMPKAAIDNGCIDKIVSLEKMAEEIIKML